MKKILPLTLVLLIIFAKISIGQVKVQTLLTENLVNPIGLDVTQPRFSWQLVLDRRNIAKGN